MSTGIEQQSISPLGWDLINDLSALPENEDIIIDFLLERLQRGQIYTWIGPLLLALNPNNEVSTSHLYTLSEFDKHINISNAIQEARPHIFAVATKAHYTFTKELDRNCQVIIISGETGTGKTFNTFKCLEFLSMVNKASMLPRRDGYTRDIMPRITDACRLISAFTTACTERNDVSSRHGQFLRLHYKDGAISGATISSFLLERSRITKGSSNFHIFYQMMFGMSDAELKAFNLSKYENYNLLSTVDHNNRKYFQEGFQGTLKALEVLGFEVDQKKNIFQVLALLIHMGNIRFIQTGEAYTIDLADQKSRKALNNTCFLSSLTEEVVIELLTTSLINPGSTERKHTVYHRYLSTVQSCCNRLHSIIRHLYELLLHWVLNRTNEALSVKHRYSEWLGILDIFGFESFDKNGIEQLCVNYANEKMQQYFVETYLENSRKDLEEESFIENNMPLNTINLYKKRLNTLEETLFLTLNDASQSPLIINMSTLIDLVCRNSHNIRQKIVTEKEGNFIIEHYSGSVAYSIEDLLSKNTDKIPDELFITFDASENKFLRSLINIEEEQNLNTVKTSTKKKTLLAKLKYNVDTLIKELKKCDVHYVRCVKPSRLKNNEWNRKEFRKQLACIGVFDALPLAKCKYPIRLHYRDFCQRYSKRPTENINPNTCKIILESIVPKQELHKSVHYGKQLIFLTEPIFRKLESYRRIYRIACVNKIKTFWIRHRHRAISAISKYSTTNHKIQDKCKPKEESTSDQIMIGDELEELNNSKEDDDVFINNRTLLQNNNVTEHPNYIAETEKEIKDFNEGRNVNEIASENKKRRYASLRSQPKALDIKKNIRKFIEKINLDKLVRSMHSTNFRKFTDDKKNLFEKHLVENCVENCDKQNCRAQYEEERNLYIIHVHPHMLFYRNGILSRRRLTAVPIKIYTGSTCLSNGHVNTCSEQPQGLQDCL